MYLSKLKSLSFLFIRQKLWIKMFFVVLLMCILSLITLNYTKKMYGPSCFVDRYLGEDLEYYKLDDILLSDRKPRKGKSIFFHETSCTKTGLLSLNARQACAIESTALLNPNLDIFVLFASPTALRNLSANKFNPEEIFNAYSNINLRNVNLWSYAAGTPIYNWLKDGQLFDSEYVLSDVSDFLRFLTLWHWGGTYLDLDIILKKTLENIKPNFAGAESDLMVAAGVINLDHEGFGHEIADLCLRNFAMKFDGYDWGANGPGVITRVLRDICKTESTRLMTQDRCFGFKVFSKEFFYAIGWRNWTFFFEEKHLQKSLDMTEQSIAIHVWNKFTYNHVVKVGSKVAYGVYAKKYCPITYKTCGKYF